MSSKFDLIKTIEEGAEVPHYSESSDEEEEFQPTKQKEKKKRDFDTAFEFVGNAFEYNKDTWNDVSKYIKRKSKNTLDEKISQARKSIKKKENGVKTEEEESGVELKGSDDSDSDIPDLEDDSDLSLSEDELVKDKIRVKEKEEKKKKKKKKLKDDEKTEQTIEFDDAPPFDEAASFYEMNLSRPLLKALGAMNFVNPTPIQSATIPLALGGRDICGCAATGTGKTAAYMLPTLERLLYRPSSAASVTRVVVLVPTRELGVQVYQVTRQLAQFTTIAVGLSVGGLDLKVQEAVLRKSPDIVIATPGRLIDHLKNTPSFSLDSVEVLILDEADRMLDEYFHEQMTEIIKECSRTRQTLLFSATMTDAVNALAAVSLTRPVRLFVDDNTSVATNLRQEFVKIRKEREGDREGILAALVCRTFHDHAMVFVQTKKQAHRLHILLGLLGVKVGELHGDLTQAQRLEALRRFKEEELDVLIATDVAARGLDIRGVKTVINFVLPATLEHYIHRVGRTARAGKSGVSVSLTGESERQLLKKIIRSAKRQVKARIIPPEIVGKYRRKVERLEEEIKRILDEEKAEKIAARAEAQANKAEKILRGEAPGEERHWFQDSKQRKAEKERQKLSGLPANEKGEKKGRAQRRKKNKDASEAEKRAEKEVEKVMLYQARLAKKARRSKPIRAMTEGGPSQFKKGTDRVQKKKKSSFAEDLTDVSRKGVKKARYQVTEARNAEKYGKKGGKNQPKKGGNFANNATGRRRPRKK